MKVKLIPVRAVPTLQRIVLHELPATFGRSPEADVQLNDTWVSRWHCELAETDEGLVIRDLESRHGTFVNGRRVQEARLAPHDIVTIGYASYQVRYRSARLRTAPSRNVLQDPLGDDESAHAYAP